MASQPGDNHMQPVGPASIPRLLTEMPYEILSKILEEVVGVGPDRDRDTTSLARLAQTCKTISGIAFPMLYCHIKDYPRSNDAFNNSPRHRGHLNALHLFLTLQNNPNLGALVRSFDFAHNYSPTMLGPQLAIQAYHGTMHQIFGVSLAHLSIYRRTPIIELAFAFFAPQLNTLKFTASSLTNDTDFLLVKVNRRVIGPRLTFDNLTSLTLHWSTIFTPINDSSVLMGINLHKINGLLHATPALTTLTIDRPRGGTSLNARLPHLTSLTLTTAYLAPRALRVLLRASAGLVHFHYTPDGNKTSGRYLPASPAQVLDALAPAKRSLRRLHLGACILAAHDHRAATYPLLVDELAGFGELRQVAVEYRGVRWRRDGRGLARLLRGCEKLEGVFFFGVCGMEGVKVKALAKGVGDGEWPRLREVRLQAWRGEPGEGREGEIWRELEDVMQAVDGEVMGMRDAGVRVVALPGDVVTGAFADE